MRARIGLGVLAGLLLTAALPPFGWWPLALVGAGLLAALLAAQPARVRAVIGLATGAGLVYPGLWWMKEFSLPGYLIAGLLECALVVVGALLTPPGRWRWLGFGGALVVVEALRGRWPFGGVPVAMFAQTQVGGPLAQVARVGGPLLVAGLVAVVGAGLAAAAGRRQRVAALAAVTVLVATVLGTVAADGVRHDRRRVALVQGGGERGTRAIDTSSADVYRAHRRASAGIRPGTDLMLWPEDVVDVQDRLAGTPLAAELSALADRLDVTLVAGIVEDTDGGRFRNYAQAWGTNGQMGESYAKHQRVPFGEYIPFRSVIERVADVSAVPRDAIAGRGPAVLHTEAGPLGVVISYEVFFARRARAAVRDGGEIILVPTNASSYSSTQMPALELGAARLRAIETGRWVIQTAPTGFSAVIDPRGNLRAQSDLGRAQVLDAAVELRRGTTPYARLGDWPLLAFALAALASAWVLELRERRARW